MSTLALIAMGSNLGDRGPTLEAAVGLLHEAPGVSVRAVSSFHETLPAGGPAGQGAFLNAAAALETTLEPSSLLRKLHEAEDRLGRSRTVRWGERTLDLDLLLFGDSILDTPDLTVPHLRMAVRRFVLAPLAEIAPEAVDPLTRRTVAGLLANLDRRPGLVALARSACAPRLTHALGRELRPSGWMVTDTGWDENLPAVRPTFVVVAGAEAEESLNTWARKSRPGDPERRSVPILRIRRAAAEETEEATAQRIMAEVLAACASARG
jgi:2-amino-4-hydroxy-6-hydroxymethyldihydropteridine diphosphokinase